MVVQNVGHHLVGAGRLEDLKQLLSSPGWLERKLHSYGTASAVADFRRLVPSVPCPWLLPSLITPNYAAQSIATAQLPLLDTWAMRQRGSDLLQQAVRPSYSASWQQCRGYVNIASSLPAGI